MEGSWTCNRCGVAYGGVPIDEPGPDDVHEVVMTCGACGNSETFKVYWSQSVPRLRSTRGGPAVAPPRFCPGLDRFLRAAADALGRTRFVLERNPDGTWAFGAPSMLSYSPRPGDMAGGATATEAMREWIEAMREGEDG